MESAVKTIAVIHVYSTGHIHSRTVCEAFAAGCNALIVPPAPLVLGDVFMYGMLRGLEPTLRQAQAEGRTWYYADRGYLRASRGEDYSGYFRVTRNDYQIDGYGLSDGERFRALGIIPAPWREDGKYIVFCPPSETWCRLMGIDLQQFTGHTLYRIKALTDRKVTVRNKFSIRTLAMDLLDCWCLVTYSSNVAVEAALAGVPVICLGRCAATAISGTLDDIHDPPRPDRENWLGVLADSQWQLSEMRSGLCWRMLNGVAS